MQINTAGHGLISQQALGEVVSPAERAATAMAEEPVDFVGDTVRRIFRDQIAAMIMGADEEESGIPPLDYEL